jgi:hypothetical protein
MSTWPWASLVWWIPGGLAGLLGVFFLLRGFLRERGRWSIRIRGDAHEALLDFDKEKYWAGQLVYPLSDVLVE